MAEEHEARKPESEHGAAAAEERGAEALGHDGAKHGEHGQEEGGGNDPTHHIRDQVLFALDAKGNVINRPYNAHGHPIEGYVPRTLFSIGPLQCKAEFTKHMLSVTLVATLIFIAGMMVARAVLRGLHDNKAPRGALANLVELLFVFVRDEIVVPVGGHHLGHYTPLFITYFLFILLANLLGMVPDVFGLWGTATGNVAVTLGLGGSIYALVWLLGMYEQGPVNYIKHLVPPGTPLWMWPLMFVLELMGPMIKCFVLCVRLFANMIAGHLIIGTVLGLSTFGAGAAMPAAIAAIMLALGLPLVLGISMLELMVVFIQAYVFTLLAVVFIGAAVHPEH